MSSINPNNIDGTYPIAGQDNDSQGFRDNFTNIKNNLTFTKTEIEDLQSKAVLKSALSGVTLDNNMGYSTLSSVQCLRFTEHLNNLGDRSGTITTIDWGDAHFQQINATGSITISEFAGWPTSADLYSRMRLEITISNVAHTLTLPAEVSVGLTDIQGVNGQIITFDRTGTFLFELSSYDQGATIRILDLTRPTMRVNYQYAAPSTDFDLTVNVGTPRVIFNPAGTLAKGTLTLPNANVDATTVTVSSTQTITAFKVNANNGTTLVPSANITLTGGTSATYFYHLAETKWYKIG